MSQKIKHIIKTWALCDGCKEYKVVCEDVKYGSVSALETNLRDFGWNEWQGKHYCPKHQSEVKID